jgi:phosphatidylinositol 4-kinase B
MNSDMLMFNEKGPNKMDKRLIKQREERENELLAYQNDSIEPVLSGGEKVFTETAKEQEARIRRNSPFGGLLTWKLMRIIVKSNDDIRQEQFAMQLISQFD